MQRRVSTAQRVGICAVLQQTRGNAAVRAVDGEDEGGDAVRLRIVRVGTRLQQQGRGLLVAGPGGEQ